VTTAVRTGARRARALVPVAAVAVLTLVAACGSGSSDDETSVAPSDDGDPPVALDLSAGSTVLGLPEGLGTPSPDAAAGAARTTDDTLLYVVTFGSSTCPSVADETAASTGGDAVEITFPEPGDGACTADYVPATTVVALPDDVDPAQDLTVTIGTWGEVTLPAGSLDAVWADASA
jgi:hypothetical protein